MSDTATATADPISAEEIQKKAAKFLSLKWVGNMHAYVRVIGGLNAPAKIPPDRPGMKTINPRTKKPILTIPELLTQAKANADRWEPLLTEMMTVASSIKQYATNAMITVQVIYDKSKSELSAEAWSKLTPAERLDKKKEFEEMVGDLVANARENQTEAEGMRDKILAYAKDITADYDESKENQDKYRDWLAEEQKQMSIFEKELKVPEGSTDRLIDEIQKFVQKKNEEWSGFTGGAVGSVVLLGIVPPFGTFVGFICMGVLGDQAERARKAMVEWKKRLDRVQKFNEVKTFFKIMDGTFEQLLKYTAIAVEALGEVAGLWAMIVGDLQTIQKDSMGGVGSLGGSSKKWEAPVMLTRRLGLEASYKNLITDCDIFVQYGYVKEIKKIEMRDNK